MSQLHSILTAVHRPYAAVYADSAERLAATGFVRALGGGTVAFAADDLYKKALQLDDASEWILTAITPTWVQVNGAASLANDSVTNALLANMAQSTIKGRAAGAGTGDPTDLSAAQVKTLLVIAPSDVTGFDTQVRTSSLNQMASPTADLSINSHKLTNVTDPGSAQDAATKAYVDAQVGGVGGYTDEQAQDAVGAMIDSSLNYVDGTPLLQRAALTGDVTASAGSNGTTIANDAVTYAKMQNVSAASKLLGRGDSGSGDPQEISLGTGLSMSGTTLNASVSPTTYSGAASYVMLPSEAQGTNTDATVSITANTVYAWRFFLNRNLTVAELTFHLSTTSAGGLISFGVYDSAGTTKLIDTGTISTTSGGTKRTVLGAPVTLTEGFYWLAWTADNSTCRPPGIQNGANFLNVLNGNGNNFQQGQATNGSTGGALPSSLGGVSSGITIPTPYVKLQG